MNLDRFAVWLAGAGLADTTRAQRLVDARQIVKVAEAGEMPPARLHFAAVTLTAWAEEEDVDFGGISPQIAWLVSDDAKQQAMHGSKHRKKPARAFDPAGWKRLAVTIVKTETNEARVLEVVMVTGLRIADVLRIRRTQVQRAVEDGVFTTIVKGGGEREIYVRGPVRTAFERMLDAWNGTKGGASRKDVSSWILPESRDARPYFGAYQRVSRELKRVSKELSLEGSVHLHRMRRTLAMQAYAITKDPIAVQQLLGHADLKTTLKYIDEERPEDVASMRDKVHETFLGGDE